MKFNTPPRSNNNYLNIVVFIALVAICSVQAVGSVEDAELQNKREWVDGEIILKFEASSTNPNTSEDELLANIQLLALNDKYDVLSMERLLSDELLYPQMPVSHPKSVWTWDDWQNNVDEFELDTYYVVKYSGNYTPLEITDAYSKLAIVDFAEPNYIRFVETYIPNDPKLNRQWYLKNLKRPGADIHAEEAWWFWKCKDPTSISAKTPIVAIVDTGVRKPNHIDLVSNEVGGYDFYNGDTVPNDVYGHGTKVAGIVAASTHNGEGIASPAWNKVRFMPLRASRDDGGLPVSYIVQAILYAVQRGVDAINMSFGWYTYSQAEHIACRFAYANGVVNIASKGNDVWSAKHYPSDFKEVVAVVATDDLDKRWVKNDNVGSNYGVDSEIAAPGYDMYTTNKYGGYTGYINGTSFSAPQVSVAAALIANAVGPTTPPSARVDQTRAILSVCVNDVNGREYPGWDIYLGHGRLNMYYIALYMDALMKDKGLAGIDGKEDIQKLDKTPIVSVPYPNPVKNSAIFNFTVPGGYDGPASLDVFDVKGRKIETKYFTASGIKNSVELNTTNANLASGVYIARVKTGEYSSTVKFVIER